MALNEKPVVAVTAPEYRKGSDIFASASDFEMLPAPSGEAELAAWIRDHKAYAAVVGTAPYRDELYRALPSGGALFLDTPKAISYNKGKKRRYCYGKVS